jgi:transcriptional regulator with XRE-family HTH domain
MLKTDRVKKAAPAREPKGKTLKRVSLADQLREAIKGCGLTHYRIAKESGVQQTILSRFATAERNVQLDTAEKLAAYFGMTLTPPQPPKA